MALPTRTSLAFDRLRLSGRGAKGRKRGIVRDYFPRTTQLRLDGYPPKLRTPPPKARKNVSVEHQNNREPLGISVSGANSTTSPTESAKPSVSTSDIIGPICRGGKLTTAATCRPINSSAV